MLFLLDENIAKCCARPTPIYTAQRSVHVKGLGPRATDLDIFLFVLQWGWVLVTRDGDDFESIMRAHGRAIPMLTLPGTMRAARQRDMLLLATPIIKAELTLAPCRQFAFDEEYRLLSYDL